MVLYSVRVNKYSLTLAKTLWGASCEGVSSCSGDTGSGGGRSRSWDSRNSRRDRKSQTEIYLVRSEMVLRVQKTDGSFLIFPHTPLSTVGVHTALLGTKHVNKYLLDWLVVPGNALVPSSLLSGVSTTRKDLRGAALCVCPLLRHPARPLASSPRGPCPRVSGAER